ncbi:MAG: hypothetical protein PUD50_08505 [Eubacteriales bacterium]|nr:hypothetical protein [Eubacteriales bacterium]
MSVLEMKRRLDEKSLERNSGGSIARDRYREDATTPGRCGLYGAYNGALCQSCTRMKDGLCDGGLQDEER